MTHPIPLPDAFTALEGAYLDAYNAIVKPDQIIPVSRYLLNYWIGDLDPIGTWLLIELRQRCRTHAHRQGASAQGRDWWRGKQSFLASAICADRKTVIDKLNKENHHPIQHFILDRKGGRRFSQRAGRSVPLSYRYIVALDDPLAPLHQAVLRSLLVVRTEKLPGFLQELGELENGDIYELLNQHGEGQTHDRWLPTVGDVVRDIHGRHITQQEEIARLCSELNGNITRPDLVVLMPWYFRDKWLHRLKHRRALMILVLRSRCFHDEEKGVDRNEIEVNWTQLREQLGIEKSQMHRLRDHPDLLKFYEVLDEAAGRKPAKVRVGIRRIPLVLEDEELYRRLVTQQGPYAIDPETGQMHMLTALSEAEKPSHFSTFGKEGEAEKPSHFSTFGKAKPPHFSPKPSRFSPKLSHFSTQTSIALIALLAPAGGSSSIAPAGPKTAAADASNLLSLSQFREREDGSSEIKIPAEWADALKRVDANRKRVSVLIDMARKLGLVGADQSVNRRQLGRLIGRSGGGRIGARTLAAAIWHTAIVGPEVVAEQANLLAESNTPTETIIAEQADSADVERTPAKAIAGQAGSVGVSPLVVAGQVDRGGVGTVALSPWASGPRAEQAGCDAAALTTAGQAGQGVADVAMLLDRLGIEEGDNRARIEATTTYAEVLDWVLYTTTQPGVKKPTAYLVSRLVKGHPPPECSGELAELPPETIVLFRRAVRYGGPYRRTIPRHLEGLFRAWERQFPLQDPGSSGPSPWSFGPGTKGTEDGDDGLTGLLGCVEVEPGKAWRDACNALSGQLPTEDLVVLRQCKVSGSAGWQEQAEVLVYPQDPAAYEVVKTHLTAAHEALTEAGIYHRLEIVNPEDTAYLDVVRRSSSEDPSMADDREGASRWQPDVG